MHDEWFSNINYYVLLTHFTFEAFYLVRQTILFSFRHCNLRIYRWWGQTYLIYFIRCAENGRTWWVSKYWQSWQSTISSPIPLTIFNYCFTFHIDLLVSNWDDDENEKRTKHSNYIWHNYACIIGFLAKLDYKIIKYL